MPTTATRTDPVLSQLREERDRARDAAIAMAESDDFDPTSDAFTALETRSASLDAQVERLVTLYGQRDAADAMDGRLSRSATRTDARDTFTAPESWGETFTRSEVFTTYPGRGTSSRLNLDNGPQTRALPTGLADLVAAGWKGGTTTVDTTPPPIPTPLLDVMPSITVSQNGIEVVQWVKVQGGADIVPEKGAKPSVEYGPTVVPATLDNIAVYTQLTRQMTEDAPAVRSLIDNELRREVLLKEETEAAAALVAATLPTADGAGSLLSGIRVGIAEVQAAGYNPNAALINPADWAALDIAVIGGTLLGPTISNTYWGLRLISSPAQPAGTVTVGDFAAGVQHYVRSGVSLYITDSHASTFLSNVFTILAERRTKTVVTRPLALCEVTAGTAPVATRSTNGK
jgi:HK97 family phage major capsid protein